MSDILILLSQYRNVFLLLFQGLIIFILILVIKSIYKKWKEVREEEKSPENQLRLKFDFEGTIDETERQNAIRQMMASDGVDPNPNSYMNVSDGGREGVVRSVTLSKLPKKVRYAETLKQLLHYPNCTASVFVKPIDSEQMSRTIDKQINILESEQITSEGNTNRVRRLGTQIRNVTSEAEKVEDGDKQFFKVGFLFTFFADSVEEMNKITDDFRSIALNKKMDISNCYGAQSEAYLANAPLNRTGPKLFKNIGSDCVKMFTLDQDALSVVLNYTTDHFTHKHGIPLGRNLFNSMPFMFDIYDPSHDGYTTVICGKTNSGKSATIKMMIERYVPRGYRFVIIDSQTRKGTSEGEYASVTEINGGTNFQISSKNTNILNTFDVQESVEFVKETATTGYEKRTLDLNSAITEMVYNLRTMMMPTDETGTPLQIDAVMDSDINDILTRIVKKLFARKDIIHGDADSLYEEGSVVRDGMLQSGTIPKKLPTITEFYKELLLEKKLNTLPQLDASYRMCVNNLREYVRELFFTENSCVFFTREEYDKLPFSSSGSSYKVYTGAGMEEPVVVLRGIRPYFDGQSTIRVSRSCPITNIDISQLTEQERKVAREIATRFMNEQFIKKNSEKLDSFDKLVGIVDEAHENFAYPYGRKTYANVVRTARKRNTGMIFATQTVKEFKRHPETEDILKQAAVKMVFKQDGQDEKELVQTLNITEYQSKIITSGLGVVTDKDDEEAGRKHKGEMCVIDGEQVLFVKVDYLRHVEALAVETNAATVIKAIHNKNGVA